MHLQFKFVQAKNDLDSRAQNAQIDSQLSQAYMTTFSYRKIWPSESSFPQGKITHIFMFKQSAIAHEGCVNTVQG